VRRTLLVLALLAATTGSAHAESKKDLYLAAKNVPAAAAEAARLAAWEKQLKKRIGKPPDPVINIVNGWTHEVIVVPEKPGKKADELPPKPIVDRFLRCRFTNKSTDMEARLLPTVIAAARHFHSRRAVIVSAFRSPKYNLMLQKKGRQVSRDSQHTHGKAIDFRLDRVDARTLDAWAKSLAMGGVGFYGSSAFVHVDTDRIRYWNGE
jgi:uncharacterized protein YcbK (DUF882 family)